MLTNADGTLVSIAGAQSILPITKAEGVNYTAVITGEPASLTAPGRGSMVSSANGAIMTITDSQTVSGIPSGQACQIDQSQCIFSPKKSKTKRIL